jgi:flagellar biosynthesis protein FliP
MLQIRNIVQQALSTGYLTVEAEDQLRQMLTKKYDREDLNAFMTLQQAAMTGQVRQQSRERLHSQLVEAAT